MSFCSARRTPNGTITPETFLSSTAEKGVAYFQEIANTLKIIDITATNIYSNTSMSLFVSHGVSWITGTNSSPEEMNNIAQKIRTFTNFNLPVPSKWLARPKTITTQSNGSIIVSFPGKFEMLGIKYMIIFH